MISTDAYTIICIKTYYDAGKHCGQPAVLSCGPKYSQVLYVDSSQRDAITYHCDTNIFINRQIYIDTIY